MPFTKKILVPVTTYQIKLLDELVETKLYSSRNDIVRHAIRDLLKFHGKL